jgi:hypothetical protein
VASEVLPTTREATTVTTTTPIQWPDGKAFAFSIVDDTDFSTLENARPVYDLFTELGLRTTKTVWPLRGGDATGRDGTSCEDPAYRSWVEGLQRSGFEIALHCVASRTSPREQTVRGIERFREMFGQYPTLHANHAACRENIYWGEARLSGLSNLAYNLLNRFRTRGVYRGHVESSPLFWGDVCRERIRYVRNFVHSDINTLRYCPQMPYHDRQRPHVNYWFASTEGPNVDVFVRALSEPNLNRLEEERGACIMYTHFGSGFAPEGRLDSRFEQVMRSLSSRDGWFVPVTTLLDHMLAAKGHHDITRPERSRLERRWLLHKIRVGGRS